MIPGKVDVSREKVAFLWLDGRLDDIVAYNEFDALTTYLVWLRVAHIAGHFTGQEYEVEQQLVRELISSEIENGKMHLKGEHWMHNEKFALIPDVCELNRRISIT